MTTAAASKLHADDADHAVEQKSGLRTSADFGFRGNPLGSATAGLSARANMVPVVLIRVRGVIGPNRFIIDYSLELSDNGIALPGLAAAAFLKKPFHGRQLVDLMLFLIAETRSLEIPVEPAKSGV